METFKSKYVIIYANGKVWQSNNEREAIARFDSDDYIVIALVRDEQQLYNLVEYTSDLSHDDQESFAIDMLNKEEHIKAHTKEKTNIFDED